VKRVLNRQKGPLPVISPGITLDRMQPGGRFGPNDEVRWETPGGQVWIDTFTLGNANDDFQLTIPDIRMPANQYWPLHWHDCWIAVIVVEGACMVGDWWMKPGDLMITAPGIEYGPLLNGPSGCQLFEIFAQDHLSPGGYSPEYHDHPTLLTTARPFIPRSGVNLRNEGNQVLPNAGVEGIVTGQFTPGSRWDLGDKDDPQRGVLACTRLGKDDRRAEHTYGDWHSILVRDGKVSLGSKVLEKDDIVVIEPNSPVPEILGASDEAILMEVSRTAAGADPIFT